MLHLNISLKNFCASPSRFCFISTAFLRVRFSFFVCFKPCAFSFPSFGVAKVEIFFLSASFFWKFYFSFCLPLCSFSIPSSLALSGFVSPCLGLQRWDSFFISARSFFYFFLASRLPSFQLPGCLALPVFWCPVSFWDCKGEGIFLVIQHWKRFCCRFYCSGLDIRMFIFQEGFRAVDLGVVRQEREPKSGR